MVDISIKHAFTSTKPDSLDPTIVSSSEWNANEIISGGTTGQIMVRNGGSLTGGSYIDGAQVQRISDSFTGSATTTPPLATTTIVFTSNGIAFLIPNLIVVLALGTDAILSIQRAGVNLFTGAMRADGKWTTPFSGFAVESPGTYTYNLLVSGTSGAVTSAQAVLNAFRVGSV